MYAKGSSSEKEEYSIEFEESEWLAYTVGEELRNAISFKGLGNERNIVEGGTHSSRSKARLSSFGND